MEQPQGVGSHYGSLGIYLDRKSQITRGRSKSRRASWPGEPCVQHCAPPVIGLTECPGERVAEICRRLDYAAVTATRSCKQRVVDRGRELRLREVARRRRRALRIKAEHGALRGVVGTVVKDHRHEGGAGSVGGPEGGVWHPEIEGSVTADDHHRL